MKSILVTGTIGFLGSHVAQYFASKGYDVLGIGHGVPEEKLAKKLKLVQWISADVSTQSLEALSIVPDLIFHAGGGGSVAQSFAEPQKDFRKTVESTSCVLEYMRQRASKAKLIYPSSVAVHGEHSPDPIRVGDRLAPVSPYGIHKLMAENLCELYRQNFSLDVSVIRFFSIYGEGLRKQLLWDACQKLSGNELHTEFWGTGKDVRDWIHIDDAIRLIEAVGESDSSKVPFVNGGSGNGHSVQDVLHILKTQLKSGVQIRFKGEARAGDPHYYVADLSESKILNWSAKVTLEAGLARYAKWFIEENKS